MSSTASPVSGDSWRRREAVYDRFEQEWLTKGEAQIEDHLPSEDDPDRPAVLNELVRIEIELRRARGQSAQQEDYLGRFPSLRPVPSGDTRLGRYELFERLGRGGFAAVYRAHDSELARDVAVKVPADDLLADPEVRSRIAREARSAARLRHPGIVPLHEVGQDGAKVWLVYEYVPGPTLAALLRQTRPAPRQAALWISQLAEALDYAHRAGIVHRDLKPANVIMRAGAEPVLTDFGLALHTEDIARLTRSGDVVGTPAYMSPEQASGRGHEVDGRSDIYSLGAMLYEMLTGQLPFRAATPAVLHQVIHEEPTPLRTIRTDIPLDLETICLKAMAKDPTHRYATAGDFADDLKRYLNHQPIRARRIGPLGQLKRWVRRNPSLAGTLSVALAVIIVVAGFSYWRVSGERDRYRMERDRAQALAANLALDRGLSLCEQGEVGPGLLWMVRSLELSPADAADHERVVRWNLSAWGTQLAECRQVLTQSAETHAILFDPADDSLIALGWNSRICRWNPSLGTETEIVRGPIGDFYAMGINADGSVVAVGCRDGFRICKRGDPPGPLIRVPDWTGVTLIACHPTRPLVVVTSGSNARVLHSTDGRPGGPEVVFGDRITGVAFSSDGKLLVSSSYDHTVRVTELESGRTITTIEHPAPVIGIAISPDGQFVATSCTDLQVRLCNLQSGKVQLRLAHLGTVQGQAFSPDGRYLLTGSVDRLARLWDTRTGTLVCPPLQHASQVFAVAFSRDGQTFATVSEDRLIRIWNLPAVAAMGAPLAHIGTVWSIAYSRDGKYFLTGAGERLRGPGTAQLWDAATRTKVGTELPHHMSVMDVAIAPDGSEVITGTDDGEIHRWDAMSGKPIGQMLRRKDYISCLGYSPTGETFAVGSGWISNLTLYDRRTGEPTGLVLPHDKPVRSVAFTRDGRTILTGSYDRTAQLWDAQSGRPIGPSLKHFGSVGAVDLSGDGRRAITGTDDNWGQIWNRDGDEFRPGVRLPHRGTVRGVALSPSADIALTGSWDKTARFWDAATGRPIGPPMAHDGEIEAVAFHPNGAMCLTGGWDKTVRVWKVPVPTQGSREQLRRWAEVLSAQELGDSESPRILESADWVARWQEMHR